MALDLAAELELDIPVPSLRLRQNGNTEPRCWQPLSGDSALIGFNLGAEPRTAALLRTLVASKPGGAFLELGTGTGISTAWILDAMDARATLLTEVSHRASKITLRPRPLL